MGGTGGTGGGGTCTESCAEATQDATIPFCDTAEGKAAEDLYNPLFACSCGTDAGGMPTGACGAVCLDNLCKPDGQPSADCTTCVLNTPEPMGCQGSFGACSMD